MTIPSRSIRLIPKSTAELNRSAESSGEIFIDKNSYTLKLFNGKHQGGFALLRADLSNLETTGASNVDFGTKVLVASGFEGNLTGNVTGQVSDISNHSMNDLSDVNTLSATSGQILGFDGTTWTPITLSGTFNGGEISGTLKVNNNTASSNTTTGALQVVGGVGVGGSVYVGGNTTVTGSISATTEVSVTGGPVSVKSNNRLRLYDTDNTNFIGLRSPTTLTSDFTFILPATYGTAGQVLQTNGAGVLSWATPTGGGGGGSTNPPGGITGSVQYSNGTSFDGSTTFTYDSILDILSTTNIVASSNIEAETISVTTNLTVTNDISADNITATGTIDGDVSSANASITGGSLSNVSASVTTLSASDSASFTKSTNSTSVSTGAVVISGGVGIGQDVNIGGEVSVNTTVTAGTSIVSNGTISSTDDITAGQNVIINNVPSNASHATNKQYVDSRSIAMAIAMS